VMQEEVSMGRRLLIDKSVETKSPAINSPGLGRFTGPSSLVQCGRELRKSISSSTVEAIGEHPCTPSEPSHYW